MGRVLTLDQLQKRAWSLANMCLLCLVLKESIDHILINCEKMSVMGTSVFFVRGEWVIHSSVKEALLE